MNKFDVVAAIIIKDDKYFIAQRNRNKHMRLSWEFPGGKVEKGETFELALKREIEEELKESRHNATNIKRLQTDVERLMEQLELLKDKVRANGSNH